MEATKLELETLDVPGSTSCFHTSDWVIFVDLWAAGRGDEEEKEGKTYLQICLTQTELDGVFSLPSHSLSSLCPKKSTAPRKRWDPSARIALICLHLSG